MSWWDGIMDGYYNRLDPVDRTYGTCYDNVATNASMVGTSSYSRWLVNKTLNTIGKSKAKTEGGIWFQGSSSTPASVVVSGEHELIDLEPPEEGGLLGIIFGYPFDELFTDSGMLWATLDSGGRTLSHAVSVDLNDDGQLDLIAVFEDGEVWESYGPFDPSDPVFPPQ